MIIAFISLILIYFISNLSEQSALSAEELLKDMNMKRVYVINLERRIDRRLHASSQLRKAKLPFEFFPGVDGKLLNSSDCTNERLSFLSRMHPRTKFNFTKACETLGPYFKLYGVVGCWQSHLQVFFDIIERAKKTGVDGPVLILEDDANVPSNLVPTLSRLMPQLPDDWDGLFLGRHHQNCSAVVSKDLCRLDMFWGAYGYILNGAKAAEKIISISNTEMIQHIDVVWLSYTGGYLNFYTAKGKQLVEENKNLGIKSDIRV
eukprot:MONOS_11285.1-p1 / transcript=MONOS_11285.1 / gene=MONOS_11285 / organism=Monocercomonoides_exilis_PA203 / gene_product=unspecified product / transcript_product=unspecified product / location=Mono_scaffold00558:34716-35501(+) / protein_length=261 / sequence_SO=supercontig / SO=protein_coding / is_pseudo=false